MALKAMGLQPSRPLNVHLMNLESNVVGPVDTSSDKRANQCIRVRSEAPGTMNIMAPYCFPQSPTPSELETRSFSPIQAPS